MRWIMGAGLRAPRDDRNGGRLGGARRVAVCDLESGRAPGGGGCQPYLLRLITVTLSSPIRNTFIVAQYGPERGRRARRGAHLEPGGSERSGERSSARALGGGPVPGDTRRAQSAFSKSGTLMDTLTSRIKRNGSKKDGGRRRRQRTDSTVDTGQDNSYRHTL